MLIGGIQTLTLLDYPETVAALVFTAGCNMRCGYCHNPELVLPERLKRQADFIPAEKVLNFLQTRKGLLQGVVISGGEPTLQPDLLSFMRSVKALGFKIKLDTNGTHPTLVVMALKEKLVDYIALDIKTNPVSYDALTCVKNNINAIKRTRDLLLCASIPYEFRTTYINGYHTKKDIQAIGEFIYGAKNYTIQNFRPYQTLQPAFKKYTGFSRQDLDEIKTLIAPYVQKVNVFY